MSRFVFRGKSGLIHVYDYIDIAQTSVYFTMDIDGNVVDQIPAHCGTLESHIKRVTLDFNANSDVISDNEFDNDPYVRRSILSGIASYTPHIINSNEVDNSAVSTGKDFIKNVINFSIKYSKFLMALWHESKAAFFISVVTASVALLLLIPAVMLATPVVLVVAVTSLITKN
jgi:hypothetical protein